MAEFTRTTGYNPHRWVEQYGGEIVPYQNYAPDPITFRSQYYYNTRTNQLFKKEIIGGGTFAVWKTVSEPG